LAVSAPLNDILAYFCDETDAFERIRNIINTTLLHSQVKSRLIEVNHAPWGIA
jgi:hypothetical protein